MASVGGDDVDVGAVVGDGVYVGAVVGDGGDGDDVGDDDEGVPEYLPRYIIIYDEGDNHLPKKFATHRFVFTYDSTYGCYLCKKMPNVYYVDPTLIGNLSEQCMEELGIESDDNEFNWSHYIIYLVEISPIRFTSQNIEDGKLKVIDCDYDDFYEKSYNFSISCRVNGAPMRICMKATLDNTAHTGDCITIYSFILKTIYCENEDESVNSVRSVNIMQSVKDIITDMKIVEIERNNHNDHSDSVWVFTL
jgi:hypothetical protein